MLEIKNLTKIYTAKGGTETRALDGVSVSFGETGLVFLLGKSGSGKSTLLNLAGGLDSPTSGEVIVMGKSSKDFSGSDFDSYRNTFVGFIFQEYNVLDEFTVEDNIALALELQGKPKDKEKIASILRDVELEAYAKRKPNTLSGGQKQRIAIARALVKDPQIIMADEPTGALDSATGKQVFDTLKSLSETRLVLVVSHDREFSEIYGDRIIELKDGKIISDVTKEHVAAEEVTENVRRIGEDTLTVHGGALDDKTLKEIEAFLKASDGEVLISKGKGDIASFRRANRIGEDGAREKFAETKAVETKEYDGKKTKFIKSRLPAVKALRIGASGLKLKPFRLVMTILLSLVSFVMFGLFSTMMFYDGQAVLEESLLSSDESYIAVEKKYTIHAHDEYSGDYAYMSSAAFTPENVGYFGDGAFGCYSVDGNAGNLSLDNSRYYSNEITRLAVLPEGNLIRTALGDKYPTGENEIAVSSYFLESAKNGTFYALGEDGKFGDKIRIDSERDLIGREIFYLGETLTITGVFDSGSIPSNYDDLKESDTNFMTEMMFRTYMDGSIHRIGFVSEAFAEAHKDLLDRGGSAGYVEYFDFCVSYYEVHVGETALGGSQRVKVYDPNDELQLPVLSPSSLDALEDDELVVSPYLWFGIATATLNAEEEELQNNPPTGEGLTDEAYEETMEEWKAKIEEIEERMIDLSRARDVLLYGQIYDEAAGSYHTPTAAETEESKGLVCSYMEKYPLSAELWRGGATMAGTYKILGFYLLPTSGNYFADGFYCSQNFYDNAGIDTRHTETTNYVPEPDAMYDTVYVPHEKTRDSVRALLSKIDVNDPGTDIVYTLNNSVYSSVQTANDLVEILSTVFLWVGVVMAVFASLLLFNFISMSITNKKKEIGILRAVGARGMDVFKIFFSESGIIVGICTVLAIVGTMLLSLFLNSTLNVEAGLQVSLFVFGPIPILFMVAVALMVAFISTFLPVYFAARKKPVESIRAL